MLKAALSSAPVQFVLAALVAGLMNLVKHTTRWDRRGLEHVEPLWASDEGVVACVWHARILATIAAWPLNSKASRQAPAILISRSRDGDLVSRVARLQSVTVVRGSAHNPKRSGEAARRGGFSAFREMMRHVQAGGCMAITPDGPRGPRMRMSLGAVKLAQATGAPLIGLGWSTASKVVFDSWDRFILPLPFSRGVIVYTKPMLVPREANPAELEACRAEFERRLNEATREADLACGGPVIKPADPTPRVASGDAAEPAA
jgi:hypothetical protein